MELIDFSVRVAAATIIIVTMGTGLRVTKPSTSIMMYGVMAPAVFSYLIATSSIPVSMPLGVAYLINIFSMNAPVLIWWFILSLFDDDFRLDRQKLLVLAISLLLFFIALPIVSDIPEQFEVLAVRGMIFLGLCLVVHIIFVMVAGYSGDLLEERRKGRIFVGVLAIILLCLGLMESFLQNPVASANALSLAQAILLLLAVSCATPLFIEARTYVASPDLRLQSTPQKRPVTDTQQRQLIKRIDEQMQRGIYLEHELSVRILAERTFSTEHKVRAAINQVMGYRNFRNFINTYRVDAAKTALQDHTQDDKTITVIAFEAGFASLASFNRIFRASTGQTPSAFRSGLAP